MSNLNKLKQAKSLIEQTISIMIDLNSSIKFISYDAIISNLCKAEGAIDLAIEIEERS